jgi:predicted dehydrogenase
MNNTKFTRRDFVRSTAAAAVATPFILPSHIWAAETKPNDRLTLGFIGVGTQGRGLLGGFLNKKETQTVAVCDVDSNRRAAAKKQVEDFYTKQNAAEYKGCAAYNDFRELLARRDIDAVVIATPDHWHALIGIGAARAQKDIYCEKPLTQSIREARELVNAVRQHRRVFQTGSMQRSSPEFRIACELVRNGAIGPIKTVDVSVGGPGVPCDLPEEDKEPGLDWDLWLGPAPVRPYHSELSPRGVHKHFPNWRKYREYGGGMVTDWGAHHFDIAQWGLDMDESGPTEIMPADNRQATQGVRLKYASGTEVIHKNSGFGVSFHGTTGKILVNRGKFEFWIGDKQIASSAREPAIEKEYLANAKVKLYHSTDHRGDWLKAIKTREKPICDVEVGARSVTVCHLANLAYYHGQPMKWDPAQNQFTDNTGHKDWLDIPHRRPWTV